MKKKVPVAARSLAYCAMLAAISIIMARLLSFSVAGGVRWSADKFPLFLAGILFGPVMGALTGFAADFLGSLMQFGFNPILCVPAVLYGLFGGLVQKFLQKKCTLPRLAVTYALPVVIGSVLYQSCALAYLYFDGTLQEGILCYLGTRSIQFAIMLAAETLILYMLIRTGIFSRLGVWRSEA